MQNFISLLKVITIDKFSVFAVKNFSDLQENYSKQSIQYELQ